MILLGGCYNRKYRYLCTALDNVPKSIPYAYVQTKGIGSL